MTISRVPLAALGITAIFLDAPLAAIVCFTVFALIDLLDGTVARLNHQETALRRIVDVLIDRVSIHGALLAVVVTYDASPVVLGILVARDLAQATYSLTLLRRLNLVVVGSHVHMSYGISVLIWGAWTLLSGGPPPSIVSVLLVLLAMAVLADYMTRAQRATRSLGTPNSQIDD